MANLSIIRAYVEKTVAEYLETDKVAVDDDGDIAVDGSVRPLDIDLLGQVEHVPEIAYPGPGADHHMLARDGALVRFDGLDRI